MVLCLVQEENIKEIDMIGSTNGLNKGVFAQYYATSFSALDSMAVGGTPYLADVQGTDGATAHNRWIVMGFVNASGLYGFQMAMSFDNKLYKRYKNNSSSWGEWVTIT